MTPEYLEELADRADPDQLWRMAGLDQLDLPPEKRKQLDTGVALRRHAHHVRDLNALIGTGRSMLLTALSKNSTAIKSVPTPQSHKHLDDAPSAITWVDGPAPELNPWHPITNTVDLKHLGKLGEELGECSAAVARCLIQGIDEPEPTTGKVNREWLEDELADVAANSLLVIERFGLDQERMRERAERKAAQLRTWHDMA